MQLGAALLEANAFSLFQSSPVPEDGCNLPPPNGKRSSTEHVSILTRPGGRVQLCLPRRPNPLGPRVSILTRPEGRVQLDRLSDSIQVLVGFNPHPSRRTGATASGNNPAAGASFNPHPSRRTGATRPGAPVPVRPDGVSILTRPEGRVQRRTTAPNSTLQSNFPAPLPC